MNSGARRSSRVAPPGSPAADDATVYDLARHPDGNVRSALVVDPGERAAYCLAMLATPSLPPRVSVRAINGASPEAVRAVVGSAAEIGATILVIEWSLWRMRNEVMSPEAHATLIERSAWWTGAAIEAGLLIHRQTTDWLRTMGYEGERGREQRGVEASRMVGREVTDDEASAAMLARFWYKRARSRWAP